MIKYLIMDVDGSLTDGKVYMGNEGESMKAFSIKDGYAMNYILKPNNIEPIIITGRTSKIVENRCQELGITKIYQGILDKLPRLKDAIGNDELCTCAYFGDDILDISCMKPIKEYGGYVGCPADAISEVKAIADYICVNKAGEGALREFAEWLVNIKVDENKITNRVNEALNYIEQMSKDNLASGVYQVNDNFYYSVQEYKTMQECDCKLESHRKYIDIQWIVEGEEKIAVADISMLHMEEDYQEDLDIMHWRKKPNIMKVVLKKDSYIVLYPRNAHMGCISVNDSVVVKKIVGKIRL